MVLKKMLLDLAGGSCIGKRRLSMEKAVGSQESTAAVADLSGCAAGFNVKAGEKQKINK